MNADVDVKSEKKAEVYYELRSWRSGRDHNNRSYNEQYDRERNAGENDQYYVQQDIRGKPVYVYGQPPPPSNAARQPPLRQRQVPVEPFDEEVFRNSFSTRQIRHRFIRKVYCILFILLAVTTAVIAVFVFEENANEFARRYALIGLGFMLGSMILYIAMACVQTLRKQVPLNIILLSIFTMLSAVGYGFLAANYSQDIVLFSAGITAGVCLLITLIACQNWVDITGWGMYLCVAALVVFIFGIIAMIVSLTTGLGRIMYIIYSSLIALVFSMYFMYTTQLILGGRKFEMSPEEYILGAIMLYIEVMTLFMAIMQLFGLARGG